MPSADRCGVLFIGVNGGVASTTIAGVFAAAAGLAPARGLLTNADLCSGLDLVPLKGFEFGGWDLNMASPRDAVLAHGLVDERLVEGIAPALARVPVWPALVNNSSERIAQLGSRSPRTGLTHRAAVAAIMSDINEFKRQRELARVVVCNVASTEIPQAPAEAHESPAAFERAIDLDSDALSAGMLYCYAAITTGAAYINFTPNVTIDVAALDALARERRLPYAGKDGRTGQTLYKSVLAPMFRARQLRVRGWYSVNILGNADGFVLSDPSHAAGKLRSKERVLRKLVEADESVHNVRIDYHSPSGDDKEAWDAIDFEGWLGRRMSMRINWRASDSMLASPLVVDLVRLVDLALRRGEYGPLQHTAMFFKDPYQCETTDFFDGYQMLSEYVSG